MVLGVQTPVPHLAVCAARQEESLGPPGGKPERPDAACRVPTSGDAVGHEARHCSGCHAGLVLHLQQRWHADGSLLLAVSRGLRQEERQTRAPGDVEERNLVGVT
eukprot:CAMPEP_0175472818 /NCGR_PEP_ID=MMETSP0095-20121207/74061_1 /TAXON_ID=311494 /ORGANISM="Alexandrium monilatum, Strain CCMP3105" /LENGTH=104 /DNA_ID=CAMNT_0016774293 /DNA_START=382 /DNA_END=693 /DNA_ORIENTATION=+